jgi:hypothetical protein
MPNDFPDPLAASSAACTPPAPQPAADVSEPLMPVLAPRATSPEDHCREFACGFQCVRVIGHDGQHLIEATTYQTQKKSERHG